MSLILHQVGCTRGGQPVLKGVSVQLGPGQGRLVVGPNGSGKTTLLGVVAGLLPHEGTIVWQGQSLEGLSQAQRVGLGVGWLPQGPSIFQSLTVEQNLLAAAELHLPRQVCASRVEEVLALFQLTPLRRRRANTLSGGERRRTELARLWTFKPRLLLLDEPFAGLDEASCRRVVKLLAGWLEEGGISLVAEHRVDILSSVLPVVWQIDGGHISSRG